MINHPQEILNIIHILSKDESLLKSSIGTFLNQFFINDTVFGNIRLHFHAYLSESGATQTGHYGEEIHSKTDEIAVRKCGFCLCHSDNFRFDCLTEP